ncbi:MAG: DUF2617 family protein [Isosphaeraceae bacterium]
MGVRSGKSKVADLTVQVFSRAVHPDWFAVREHRRLTQTSWEADVRIMEGGHVVTWRSGPIRLTEVFCGPETPLPDQGLLYQSAVRHERSTSLRPGLEVCYQTCFETERVDAEVFAHLNDELTLDASKGALFHRFEPLNRMNPAPLSRIQVESRTRGLSVQAFHTFPDELAIVRVMSLFECMPPR